MSEPTFREKYEWWNSANGRTYNYPPELIEREYDEAHPPKVTAEDVWNGFRPYGWRRLDGQDPCIRALCAEVADFRNAAREDEDEAWIEEAVEAYFSPSNPTAVGAARHKKLRDAIRAAYRSRSKA